MREILFRGKRVENGEWVYGDYCGICRVECNDGDFAYRYLIHQSNDEPLYMVDPETVGEYTGLTDKNGKRIFEGDIIEVDRIYDTPQPRPRRFEVEWEESSGFFPLTVYGDSGDYFIDTDHCEVIGNIHDNPELLEVEE